MLVSEINVFLPAAGIGGHHQGDVGFYWSSTPGTYNGAYYLWFESDDQEMHYDYRGDCYSVRAVLAE